MSNHNLSCWWIVLLTLTIAGCGSGPVYHVRSDVDFSFIRSVAVVPFQNLSAERFATQRMSSVFISELLQFDELMVLDPGEVLEAYSSMRLSPDVPLTSDQIVALGQRLGVDALVTGTVEDYGLERLGGNQTYAVTAVFGMSETQTGGQIWTAQIRHDGSSFWQKLFGGQPTSLYEVSRKAVREALGTLLGGGGGGSESQNSRGRDSSASATFPNRFITTDA